MVAICNHLVGLMEEGTVYFFRFFKFYFDKVAKLTFCRAMGSSSLFKNFTELLWYKKGQ